MDTKNEGAWQVATNKKKANGHVSPDAAHNAPIPSRSPSSSNLVKSSPDAKRSSWGDIDNDTDPELNDVMSTVADNINKCKDFQHRMTFLKDVMASIAKNAADTITEEKKAIDNKKMNDRDVVQGLHDLSQFGTSFSQSMSDKLTVIRDAIGEIENQKRNILDGWNKFVRELSQPTDSDKSQDHQRQTASRLAATSQNSMSFISALEGGKHAAIVQRIGSNTVTASVGISDIKCPVASNPKDVALMAINYIPSLSTFVINLDGSLYSFGKGKFVSRRGKNESTLYGKRCNPRIMACKGASCTYYHDPLIFTSDSHAERNMAIPYITDELIKGIATDQDILSNTTYANNPFIVEDIVQLAGMLLLRAIAVKTIINNNPKDIHRISGNNRAAPKNRDK